jgi:hypothetical protein
MMNVTGDGFIIDGTHQRSSPPNESMMIVKTWRRRRRNRKGSSNPRHGARQPRCGIRPRARITNSLPMRLASSNSACSRALVSARYRGSTRWSDIAAGGTSIRYSVVASRLRVSFMERRTANVPRCAAFLIRKPSASRSYRERCVRCGGRDAALRPPRITAPPTLIGKAWFGFRRRRRLEPRGTRRHVTYARAIEREDERYAC